MPPRIHPRWSIALFIGFILLAIPVLSGCEEDVTDLRINDHPYTIYAIVNPKADTQFVRVFAVTETPSAFDEDRTGAQVRFVDLETDETYVARDSLVEFGSGRFGHIYWAPFRAEYDRAYRIEARRDESQTVHATVRTPPSAQVELLPPLMRFDERARDRVPFQPVLVRRSGGLLQRIEAIYHVEAQGIGRDYHPISYLSAVDSRADGWAIELDLVRDYELIYEEWERRYRLHAEELGGLGVECCRVEFYDLELRATVVDTGWAPPNGTFDPELLIQPGIFENVENGFGFVGAGFEENSDIRVSRCFQYWSGYVFADDPCSDADYCQFRGQRCGG